MAASVAVVAIAPQVGHAAESRGLFGISGRMAGNPRPPNPKKQPPAEVFPAAQLWSGPAKQLGGSKSWSYVVVDRSSNGGFEVHDGWNDVMMVQEGRATLVTGGVLANGRESRPGEHLGPSVTGETTRQALGPGDVVMIPAGLPHQFVLADGVAHFRYLTVKTRP